MTPFVHLLIVYFIATCECTLSWSKKNKQKTALISLTWHINTIFLETNPTRAFEKHAADSLLICFIPLLAPFRSCGLSGSSHCLLGESPSLEIVRRLYVLQRSPTEQILVVIIMQIQGWNCISRSGSVQICMNRKGPLLFILMHNACHPFILYFVCRTFPKMCAQTLEPFVISQWALKPLQLQLLFSCAISFYDPLYTSRRCTNASVWARGSNKTSLFCPKCVSIRKYKQIPAKHFK